MITFLVLLAGIPFAFPVPDTLVAEPVKTIPVATPKTTLAASETTTAIWEVPKYSGTASCTNLVDPNTVMMFTSRTLTEVAEATARASGPSWPPYAFYENGGLACEWSSGLAEYSYAYSPLDAQQAEELKAKLAASGFTIGPEGDPKFLMTNGPERYIFGDGFWVYASSPDPHLVDEVYANVLEFAGQERTDLQDQVYVTSEGMGDLRIGKRIPRSSTLAYWDEDACGSGQGVWSASGNSRSDGNTRTVEFATAGGERNGELRGIRILTPEIPTKSGIRVGDPVGPVMDTLGFDSSKADDFEQVSLEGTAGTIAFQFGSPGDGDPKVVLAIFVVAKNDAVPTLATGDCGLI